MGIIGFIRWVGKNTAGFARRNDMFGEDKFMSGIIVGQIPILHLDRNLVLILDFNILVNQLRGVAAGGLLP